MTITMNGRQTMDLKKILNRTAYAIVENGTRSQSRTLDAMATAASKVCPGAAAALVDWDGSEIARLRAFGIVHGAILRDLTESDQVEFLAQLLDVEDLVLVA